MHSRKKNKSSVQFTLKREKGKKKKKRKKFWMQKKKEKVKKRENSSVQVLIGTETDPNRSVWFEIFFLFRGWLYATKLYLDLTT